MEQTVNERIKMLRSKLNLSQNDFATKVGASMITVSRWETGSSIPMKNLYRINEVFGVSLEWLKDGEGELEFSQSDETNQVTWKEKAFDSIKKHNEHLEQEVQFLRNMLSNVTSKMSSANFNPAFGLVGLLPQKASESVRAVA
jgi:transcriptional regulator with XRE-family HTH domain